MWEQFIGADRTSVVDEPAIAVAHRVVLLDDGDDAALGQRQVQLLCCCHFLRDDVVLRHGVRGLHVGPLSRALTALRNVITLPTGSQSNEATHTHVHTCLTALFPGLPRWADTRKVKTNLDFTEVRDSDYGSGISWAICKSASRSRQITMPVPHHSSFLQARCPSCRPTNSVKALKAKNEVTNEK